MAVSADQNPEVRAKQPFHLIQGLRGLAALMVVAHHSTIMAMERLSVPGPLWRNGAAGVDIFFVISGFVMALSSGALLRSGRPGLEFLKRRVERIVPLYWIATTVKVLIIVALPAAALHGVGSRWHVIASYLFLPSRNAGGLVSPVIVVGWTLNLEMMFYVVFALALALRLRPLRLLVPVLGMLALLPYLVRVGQYPIESFANPIVLEFLYGIALYRWYERGMRLPLWLSLAAGGSGFATLMLVANGAESPFRPFVWGLAALAIVASAISLEGLIGRRLPPWALEVGDASYAIYLAHTLTLPLAGMALVRLHMDTRFAMAAAVTAGLMSSVAAGELVYRGLELPMIRFFRQRRTAAVPTGT